MYPSKLNNRALATRATIARYPSEHICFNLLGLYSSNKCTFCDLNKPETTIHLIGECPHWKDHRENLVSAFNSICKQANLPLPPSNLLLDQACNYQSLDSTHIANWEHYSQLSASLGNIPTKIMLDTYSAYLNYKAILKLTANLTETIISHQYILYLARNKQFHSINN